MGSGKLETLIGNSVGGACMMMEGELKEGVEAMERDSILEV